MIAKIYKLGKSGRLAIMLPKEAQFEVGDYEIQIGAKQEAKLEEAKQEDASQSTNNIGQ